MTETKKKHLALWRSALQRDIVKWTIAQHEHMPQVKIA
jgi:hypothetical protein